MNIDARAGVGSPLISMTALKPISMTALKPISMTALKQKHQARREPELNPGHIAKPPSKQKKHKRGEKEKKPRQKEESPLGNAHKPKHSHGSAQSWERTVVGAHSHGSIQSWKHTAHRHGSAKGDRLSTNHAQSYFYAKF